MISARDTMRTSIAQRGLDLPGIEGTCIEVSEQRAVGD